MAVLEGPDEMISLARAAEIAGLSPVTLGLQARKGRLQTVKPAHDRLTTRRWLHRYLQSRTGPQGGTPAPLPASYTTPDGEEQIT
jgi:hypothetical protein